MLAETDFGVYREALRQFMGISFLPTDDPARHLPVFTDLDGTTVTGLPTTSGMLRTLLAS